MRDRNSTLINAILSTVLSSILLLSLAVNAEVQDQAVEKEVGKITTSGYGSAYFVKANKDIDASGVNPVGSNGIGDDWSLRPDLIFGFQTNYQIEDRASVVLQLKAEGNDDMDINAEWAYFRYELMPDLYVRVGRLRIPYYLYSESLDVGYTYPWVRPPIELYLTEFSHHEGVDLQWNFLLNNWGNQLQFAYSSLDDDVVKVRDTFHLAWTGYSDYWTVRGSVQYTDKVTLLLAKNDLPTAGTDKFIYFNLGGSYDNGVWLVISEFGAYDVGDKLPVIGQSNFTFTVGRRFNQWMPYLSLAKGYSTKSQEDNIERHAIPKQFVKSTYAQQSVGLGLRYEVSDAVVIKSEIVHYSGFENGGNFRVTDDTGLLDPQLIDRLGGSINLMSFGFDFLF